MLYKMLVIYAINPDTGPLDNTWSNKYVWMKICLDILMYSIKKNFK